MEISNNQTTGLTLITKEESSRIQSQKSQIKSNTYQTSNFVSKLFFSWTIAILKYSKTNKITHKDLGELSHEDDSKSFHSSINTIWNEKGYKNFKKIPLICTILRANIGNFVLMMLLSFFSMILDVMVIVFLKDFLSLFQNKNNSDIKHTTFLDLDIKGFGICLLLTKLLHIIISKQSGIIQALLGAKASVQLQAMILEKLIRISFSAKANYNEGEIANFVQVDAKQVSDLMRYSTPFLWIPLQLLIYIWMLYLCMGYACLAGIAVLVLYFIIVPIIQYLYYIVETELMNNSDDRMKVTTEAVSSLKIIKMYAWEDEYLEKINIKRNTELKAYDKKQNLEALDHYLYYLIPILASNATIGTYVYYFDNKLDTAKIISGVTIFKLMQDLLWYICYFSKKSIETLVGMIRIEKFLLEEDRDDKKILSAEHYSFNKFAIKVENCDFQWGLVKKSKLESRKIGDSLIQKNCREIEISQITNTESIMQSGENKKAQINFILATSILILKKENWFV